MAFQIVAIGNQVTWMPVSGTNKTSKTCIHIKLFLGLNLPGC